MAKDPTKSMVAEVTGPAPGAWTGADARKPAAEATPSPAAPLPNGIKELPAAEAVSGPRKQKFSVSLPHTCGEKTIRPPLEVEVEIPGGDAFAAGYKARETAVAAFNRHYGILGTEHKYKVDMVA